MIELPTERSVVDNYNPRLLIIFGKPKCGKSSFVAAIDDNLIIDLEDGYRAQWSRFGIERPVLANSKFAIHQHTQFPKDHIHFHA